MSSGTYVNVGHYFARYHYRDKAELKEMRYDNDVCTECNQDYP